MVSRRRFVSSVVLLGLLPLSAGPSRTASFQIIANAYSTAAADVSADGSAILVYASRSPRESPSLYRWRAGVNTLVSARAFPGGASSRDGSVIAGADADQRAFRWQNGQLTYLGSGTKTPNEITADGSTIVGFGAEGAFAHRGGAVTYLDVPDGAIYSNALGVSEDGVVIVGQVNFSSGSEQWAEAVRWRDGVMERLGDVARGGSKGAAKDVTPDGSIIIGNGAGATRDQAFRWENGVMTLLGKLRGHSTAAMAVSADGSTIVGIAYNGGDRSRGHGIATIWDPAHGMRELKQVLEQDHGLDLSAFELNWANGISSDGRTIAGQGTVLDPGANREYAEREITWVVTFSKPSIWRCSTSAWSAAPR